MSFGILLMNEVRPPLEKTQCGGLDASSLLLNLVISLSINDAFTVTPDMCTNICF